MTRGREARGWSRAQRHVRAVPARLGAASSRCRCARSWITAITTRRRRSARAGRDRERDRRARDQDGRRHDAAVAVRRRRRVNRARLVPALTLDVETERGLDDEQDLLRGRDHAHARAGLRSRWSRARATIRPRRLSVASALHAPPRTKAARHVDEGAGQAPEGCAQWIRQLVLAADAFVVERARRTATTS